MWQKLLRVGILMGVMSPHLWAQMSSSNLSPSSLYPASTWLQRCSEEIDNRISGKESKVVIPWRNGEEYLTTSWAYGLDLTAVAIARGAPRGVAITPRHVLYTKHYGWHAWPGQTVKFLTMDNKVISRQVEQVRYLGSPNDRVLNLDIAVVRLVEDLPDTISPMKLVAPLGLSDVAQRGCPILRIDQENKALLVVADMFPKDFFETFFRFLRPTDHSPQKSVRKYAPYYESMIPGDSTSPSILLYRDQNRVTPFLISQVTAADLGHGPNASGLAGDIQQLIEQFGDTEVKYQLVLGPDEFTRNSPLPPNPTCELDIVYKKKSAIKGTCYFNLKITNESFIATYPLTAPEGPSWKVSRNKKKASGVFVCDGDHYEKDFTVFIKGPSGHGTCSGTVH